MARQHPSAGRHGVRVGMECGSGCVNDHLIWRDGTKWYQTVVEISGRRASRAASGLGKEPVCNGVHGLSQ
jgi:hypothetical protein